MKPNTILPFIASSLRSRLLPLLWQLRYLSPLNAAMPIATTPSLVLCYKSAVDTHCASAPDLAINHAYKSNLTGDGRCALPLAKPRHAQVSPLCLVAFLACISTQLVAASDVSTQHSHARPPRWKLAAWLAAAATRCWLVCELHCTACSFANYAYSPAAPAVDEAFSSAPPPRYLSSGRRGYPSCDETSRCTVPKLGAKPPRCSAADACGVILRALKLAMEGSCSGGVMPCGLRGGQQRRSLASRKRAWCVVMVTTRRGGNALWVPQLPVTLTCIPTSYSANPIEVEENGIPCYT